MWPLIVSPSAIVSTIILCTTFGVGVVTTSPTNSTNMTQFRSTVVYSFANVTSTPAGSHTTILTIATGPDDQLHYVHSEDGKKKEGIWTRPLPSSPKLDLDDLSLTPTDSSANHSSPASSIAGGLSSLSQEIDSSINGYLSGVSWRLAAPSNYHHCTRELNYFLNS